MKYLDKTGLTYLWSKIKSKIPTKTSQLTNDSNYITSSGNAGSATKLQTGRTIGIGTGGTGTATSFDGTKNITIPLTDVKDSYVTWGGKSMTTLSPNDMGCVDEFGHNKLAFLPANKISVEYTTDGGTTWIDYGLTDTQKVALVTTNGPACMIGKGTVSASSGTLTNENCSNYKVRVTLNGIGSLYTICKKILVNMSTMGANGCKLKIEARTYTNYHAGNDIWRDIATYDVAGWSGWNSLPVSTTYGGQNNWSDAELRFTLSITSVNTSYTCQAHLIDFRMIGINNWSTPSELARAGHIYKIDTDQSALFPANITPQVNNSKTLGTSSLKWNNVYATTFTGNLSGNATTATSATSSDKSNSTYILDTRSVNSTPNDYMGGGRRVVYEFKNISAINTPFSSGTYCTLKTVCQWDNTSGGLPIQIAYSHTSTKPVMRVATSGTTWGEWKTIALTSDIPTKVSELTNDSGYTTNTGTITGITMNGASKGTSGVVDLGTVITAHQDISGKQDKITSTNKLSYTLLKDTPTIPTVNNATLTIQKNGTNVQTFTANSSTNATANIIVPTKTSDITNDSGFITNSTSDLDNYYTISETNSNFVQSGDISRVATTGSYNDLSDKPTIPLGVTMEELISSTKILGSTGNSVAVAFSEPLTNYKLLLINICANPSTHTGEWSILRPISQGCISLSTQFYQPGSYRLIVRSTYDGNKTLTFQSVLNEFNGTSGVVSVLGVKF